MNEDRRQEAPGLERIEPPRNRILKRLKLWDFGRNLEKKTNFRPRLPLLPTDAVLLPG